MTFKAMVYATVMIWVAGCAACFQSFQLARQRHRTRYVTAIVFAAAAVGAGLLGISRFRVNYSQTVNGQMRWHIDSRWFFAALLAIATAALVHAVWRKVNAPPSSRGQ